MKYIALVAIVLVISFIAVSIFTIAINRKKTFKENIKYTITTLFIMLPILILVGGSLFLAFKLIAILANVNIPNFKMFLISILGVYVIFICDFIGKKILVSISSKLLAKKYSKQYLSEKDMMDIIENNSKYYKVYAMIIMFFISVALYTAIMLVIKIEFTMIFLGLISLVNLVTYWVFFRANYRTENR